MTTDAIQLRFEQLLDFIPHARSRSRRFAGCEQLVERSRSALRLGRLSLAEAFVREGGYDAARNAECLNVLGLIAEARGEWAKARRCWSCAARLDRTYQPSRQNLRRYFELFQFGRSDHPVTFGDETAFPSAS